MQKRELPIKSALPRLLDALATHNAAVLQAPPGAGKTTRVPLALLEQPWLEGRRILMLEPRRLAARAAAIYMSELLGEKVGDSVGYRMRMESCVDMNTRIEVITEGILTRLLQSDPGLENYMAVIFDEFHERSLQADLGLTLCLDTQANLREDLKILVMSATLDGAAVARLLGDAPLITSEGKAFPVTTHYLGRSGRQCSTGSVQSVVAAVRQALSNDAGDILVFLPGAGEIRRTQTLLNDADLGPNVTIAPLFGMLPQSAQDSALRPSPSNRRKIVLATSIAETSLTIEGIRIVIDSGFMRVPRFDASSGMSRLETVRVSVASADQRRGRAGRQAPGVCYRLWAESEQATLLARSAPEIKNADQTTLALELAIWGVSDPERLNWLDEPPRAAFVQARGLLTQLEALDDHGQTTHQGHKMAKLAMHPRLAHMVLKARDMGLGVLACRLAALLGERDILREHGGARDVDLRYRLEILEYLSRKSPVPAATDRGAASRVLEMTRLWQQQLGIKGPAGDVDSAGLVTSLAYPDRIGLKRTGQGGRYLLASGRGAGLDASSPLAAEKCLCAALLDGAGREARIFLAAPLMIDEVLAQHGNNVLTGEEVAWNDQAQAVLAMRRVRFGALILKETPLSNPDKDAVLAALLKGIRGLGLTSLPWDKASQGLLARICLAARIDLPPGGWPSMEDEALLVTLDEWLGPHLSGVTRIQQLASLDLAPILSGNMSWAQRQVLETQVPTHLKVPSGSRIPIDYLAGETPVLAVRLQEMFGLSQTPVICAGRVPLVLHLLSPAQRPIQITQDLANFWTETYAEVRKDLRGRYPRHYWPEDPLEARPTRRAKPRS